MTYFNTLSKHILLLFFLPLLYLIHFTHLTSFQLDITARELKNNKTFLGI